MTNFKDLPLIEQKDILICRISGDSMEVEMFHMISIFTAYKLDHELALENNLDEYITDGLIERFDNCFYGDCEEEDFVWNIVIKTLGDSMIWDIIEDISGYMGQYNDFMLPLNRMKGQLLNNFVDRNIPSNGN